MSFAALDRLLNLLLLGEMPRLWYLLPLLVSVSLVYGATRHEHFTQIMEHSIRFAVGMLFFLAILFAILWVVTYGL